MSDEQLKEAVAKLPEAVRDALAEVVNAAFDVGDWRKDLDEEFDELMEASLQAQLTLAEAIRAALACRVPATAANRAPVAQALAELEKLEQAAKFTRGKDTGAVWEVLGSVQDRLREALN